MKKPSIRFHMRRAAAVAVAALAFGCNAVQADVVTSASIAGDPAALLNSLDTIGAFTFVPPLGVVTSASVSLDSYDVLFDNTASFFLDGVLLGTLNFGSGQSTTFAVTDFSIFSDGSAVLSWEATDFASGCPCVIPNGDALLEIRSADTTPTPVPEPTSLPLVLAGLATAWAADARRLRYLVKPLGLFARRALREP
jgi:hypothetical protein